MKDFKEYLNEVKVLVEKIYEEALNSVPACDRSVLIFFLPSNPYSCKNIKRKNYETRR